MAKRHGKNFMDYLPRKGKTVRIEKSTFSGAPPVWFGLLFIGAGIGLPFLFASLLKTSAHDPQGRIFDFLLLLLLSGAFLAGGIWSLYLRLDIPRSLPIEDLSQQLGLSEAELKQAAQEKGVVPRYNINGRDFYRRADFDVTSLLRATTAPVPTEQLLRAAEETQTSPQLLVRGSSVTPPSLTTSEERSVYAPKEEAEKVVNVRPGQQ